MASVHKDRAIPAPLDEVDENDRAASIARLHDLFSDGMISHEHFSEVLEQVFAALSRADLEAAMMVLPPLVRSTPAFLRLTRPLVVRAADGRLRFGPGWQLAADTTISTGFGSTRVDLTEASWDAQDINLRLETWNSIEVVVPEGVAVQPVGGSRPVQLQSISRPIPGGPILRISTFGPTGMIRICHPEGGNAGRFVRWRRRRSVSKSR
jgi:hypothetical protein